MSGGDTSTRSLGLATHGGRGAQCAESLLSSADAPSRTSFFACVAILRYGNSTRQTRQIEHTLCRVLTHQLDWSLDDLPLDDIERQIVDTLLAEVPAPGFTESG